MTNDYSSDAFKTYLDDVSNFEGEGQSIVHNLKGTATRLMANVHKGQFSDIRHADVEELIELHLQVTGASMSPHSKLTYKSRFNRAVSRFIAHQNKIDLEPAEKIYRELEDDNDSNLHQDHSTASSKRIIQSPSKIEASVSRSFDVPILIRPETGVTVEISGVPLDLTNEEAERIASILKIYARP